MRKVLAVVLIALFFFECKNAGSDVNGDKPIKPDIFLKFFRALELPISIADTGLSRFGDTTVINHLVFTQFIPDSVLQNLLGKQAVNYVIHPAGSIHNEDGDYLLTKFSLGKAIKLAVFLLDEKHNYVSSLELVKNYDNDKYNRSVSITSEPTFIIRRDKIGKNNELLFSRNGYAFNSTSSGFSEVMNDSNEDTKKINEILNPVDTFPSTNKFSGDYGADKKNFISVRDGKDALTYAFFIHFEKNGGDCTGELKGEMSLTDDKNAVFQESGDPCVIHFKFSGNSVNVKEEGNCGNHRGITCPYDFSFKKKRVEAKTAK